jgi:hypothetical protein
VRPSDFYTWEIELINGKIRKQYEDNGMENTWKDLPTQEIVRVSINSTLPVLPSHTIIIDVTNGERFVKRFCRGFLKLEGKEQLKEYVHCVVTNKYRFWVFHDGKTVVTRPDYELYI